MNSPIAQKCYKYHHAGERYDYCVRFPVQRVGDYVRLWTEGREPLEMFDFEQCPPDVK